MRPIPAPRIGDSHGLLRAIDERERVRLDEFVTEFSVEDLFPPELENAIGRTRQFVSFARAAGLLKEDHGTVELTEVGRRYIRAGDAERPFDVSPSQAEWLRRQLREKHMTDSIFHGLAIGLSLLASAPGAHVATLDFGRALGYLGRAGWDNENTLESQGERHVTLLRDMELLDEERRLTPTGTQVKSELTLPIHMSLPDIAAQLNPGGADAVREAGEAEWAAAAAPPPPAPAPPQAEDEYADVGPGSWVEVPAEPAAAEPPPPPPPEPAAPAGPPVPPPDIWDTAAPDEATRAYSAVPPPAADEAPAGAADEADVGGGDEAGVRGGDEAGVAGGDEAGVRGGDEAGVRGGDEAGGDEDAVGGAGEAVVGGGVAAGNGAGEVGPAPEPVAPEPDPADAATVISTPPQSPAVEPPPPPPAPPAPAPAVGAASAAVVPPEPPAPSRPPAFVGAGAVGAAAAEQGLRMDAGVYANVAAALATGRHVVLVGPPGSGKTTLALAVAKAAVEAGRADGAELVGAAAGDQILAAARRNRWLVIDGLVLDDSLAPLSAFLSHLPVTLPGEDGEVAAPETWRIVATASERPTGSLSTRFAAVDVAPHEDLEAAIDQAAGGDRVAAAAVRRLLPLRDVASLGAGPYLAAARHAAERRTAAPTDEATLAREVLAAYLAPLLDEEALARARDLL